jgi:hypothetical protein
MNRPERYFRGRLAALLTGGALVAALFPMAGSVLAASSVTPATGGTAISADSAGTATYTTLTGPSIVSAGGIDISGTLTLAIPTGFVFKAATGTAVLSGAGCTGLAISPGTNITTTNVTVTTTGSAAGACNLDLSGLQVQPTAGLPGVSGNIAASGLFNGNAGVLTEVAGPFSKLQVLVPGETAAPGTTSGKTGAPFAQTTGVAFSITVKAVDANWNPVSSTDTVRITSSDGAATLPANTALVAGAVTLSVTLNTAGSNTVTAADFTDGTKTASTSGAITVIGPFAKLQILVPGETAAPGTATGKTGTPTAQAAGAAFTVTVRAVDVNWNPVTSTNVVGISSSDAAANLPANAALVAGAMTFTVTLNTLGSKTVIATDITDGTKTANTSAAIIVNGAFAKLQVIVPGETAAPNTTTGKTGTPNAQTAGVAFTVTVNAVDANWNVVSSTHTVGITSSDSAATLPASAALVGGTKTFSITLNTAGSRTVTATDLSDGTKTASTSAAISVMVGSATKLGFTAQPTSAGSNVAFTIQPVVAIQDAGGNTITTAPATLVALSLGVNPSAGTLTCTGGLTRTTLSGVASFSGCSIDHAGVGYTIVAAATGYTSTTSTAFTVGGTATSVTITTSAPTPPGAQNPVITWGQGFNLGVQFAANGSGQSVQLQGTRDGVNWTTITILTMGTSGGTTYHYTPVTNLWYRAVFAGTPEFAAATSNQVRTVVREIALLRPTNSGNTRFISRNTSITFTTTVRPARPELAPAKVSFWFYHQVNGSWVLAAKRDVVIDGAGLAHSTFTFSSSGEWYVRMAANPTPYNANSVMSPVERYSVN